MYENDLFFLHREECRLLCFSCVCVGVRLCEWARVCVCVYMCVRVCVWESVCMWTHGFPRAERIQTPVFQCCFSAGSWFRVKLETRIDMCCCATHISSLFWKSTHRHVWCMPCRVYECDASHIYKSVMHHTSISVFGRWCTWVLLMWRNVRSTHRHVMLRNA